MASSVSGKTSECGCD